MTEVKPGQIYCIDNFYYLILEINYQGEKDAVNVMCIRSNYPGNTVFIQTGDVRKRYVTSFSKLTPYQG